MEISGTQTLVMGVTEENHDFAFGRREGDSVLETPELGVLNERGEVVTFS